MAALCEIKISLVVIDSSEGGIAIERVLNPVRFAPGAGSSGQHQTFTLANGDNTLTVPTGAKLLLLELTSSAPVLKLKGNAGDTGIPITPTSNPVGVATLLTLGTSPTVIINNAGTSYSVDGTWC